VIGSAPRTCKGGAHCEPKNKSKFTKKETPPASGRRRRQLRVPTSFCRQCRRRPDALRLAMKEATASKFIGLLISDGPNALKMAKHMLRKAAIRLREPPRGLRREQRQPRKWRTLRVSTRLHGNVTAGLGWTMATTEVPFHPMLYDLFARSELPVQSGYTSPKKKGWLGPLGCPQAIMEKPSPYFFVGVGPL
jgi:hypothetical protein